MRVLALSPHADDIELGCGGFITKLKEQGNDVHVITYCFSGHSLPPGKENIMRYEFVESMKVLGLSYTTHDYKVRTFYQHRKKILQSMIDERKQIKPDLVLCPSVTDIHQDHQVIHWETVRAFSKECNVLAYELPWNCRGFVPQFFVELKEKHLTAKLDMMGKYQSQFELDRNYFDRTLIRGFARTRGLQVKMTYAEAFEVITYIQ